MCPTSRSSHDLFSRAGQLGSSTYGTSSGSSAYKVCFPLPSIQEILRVSHSKEFQWLKSARAPANTSTDHSTVRHRRQACIRATHRNELRPTSRSDTLRIRPKEGKKTRLQTTSLSSH